MPAIGPTQSYVGDGGEPDRGRWSARNFLQADRYLELDRKLSFFENTQHDYKRFDFEGRMVSNAKGVLATQPLLAPNKFIGYVPLASRRPSSPYRLARVIVKAFTKLTFGEGRFPTFKVAGDDDSQDYVQALVKAMSLPTKMIRARDLGGATGSVGISWCFKKGKPRCQVHSSRNLYVHSWHDRDALIPKHVTELKTTDKVEWDRQKLRYVTNTYWHRRDWLPDADVVFEPVLVENQSEDPEWIPDPNRSVTHNDGVTHFEWIQNLPTEDEVGDADYEGLFENFDTLDIILSVLARGGILNLDPTLVLKLDQALVDMKGVKKGSDNSLVVGEGGDAKYLELSGMSIKAGVDLFNATRMATLEVAQCVLPNPSDITANGTSSVAMKMLYAPMLGQCDVLREQYAQPMNRMLTNMLKISQSGLKPQIYVKDDGTEETVQHEVDLPQKAVQTPKLGDGGMPTGEMDTEMKDRDPGDGEEVEANWGPYFMPTPSDQQATITTLGAATGGAPFMSAQTATEIAMQSFGREPADEAKRVAQEQQAKQDQQAKQFADHLSQMGGQIGAKGQLPGGATPGKPKPGGGGAKPPKPPKAGGGGADPSSFGGTGGFGKDPSE